MGKILKWGYKVYCAVIGRNIIATTDQTWENSGDSPGYGEMQQST